METVTLDRRYWLDRLWYRLYPYAPGQPECVRVTEPGLFERRHTQVSHVARLVERVLSSAKFGEIRRKSVSIGDRRKQDGIRWSLTVPDRTGVVE